MNITNYAFENIKKELLLAVESAQDPGHESHVAPGEKCLCVSRKNYRLPCRHELAMYPKDQPIPLDAVHQRWRISYIKGKGMYCSAFELSCHFLKSYQNLLASIAELLQKERRKKVMLIQQRIL